MSPIQQGTKREINTSLTADWERRIDACPQTSIHGWLRNNEHTHKCKSKQSIKNHFFNGTRERQSKTS
jgi:hypothetical protein